MSILIQRGTKVMIQGIIGPCGERMAKNMIETKANIVAAVTPGQPGQRFLDIPVYNTVAEAWRKHGPIDSTVILAPASEAKKALIEALTVDLKTILMQVEKMPLHDAIECVARCKKAEVRLLGPGSAGLVSPQRGSLGTFGSPEELSKLTFQPGRIGVISRSRGQTTTLAYNVCKAGYGISTAIHLGSEQILGTTFSELLQLFEKDDETDGVVYYGEIGSILEEEAAQLIEDGMYTKPLIVYIAGKGLPKGIRFSHASAIVEGENRTAEKKTKVLKKAGAHVLERPEDLSLALKCVFKNSLHDSLSNKPE